MKYICLLFLLFCSTILYSQEPLHSDAFGFESPKRIEPAQQLEASLQVIRIPPRVYSRFPEPTNLNEKRELRIIKIVSVSLVLLLILYLLFRKRKSI